MFIYKAYEIELIYAIYRLIYTVIGEEKSIKVFVIFMKTIIFIFIFSSKSTIIL